MSLIQVMSAQALSEDSKRKIETVFRKKHDEAVEFAYAVDGSLIGGILVIDGECYYDATVKGQLAVIKRNLK